jgi:hypothetical protein
VKLNIRKPRAKALAVTGRGKRFMMIVSRHAVTVLAGALSGAMLLAAPAAIAQDATEKETLTRCERDICGMITGKKKEGADLSCDLIKTWNQEDIQEGAKSKNLSWAFGRARCSVKINIKRADIVDAVATPAFTLKIAKQPVDCEIERESEKYPIKMTLAPELVFKDGKVTDASLGVDDIEGASLIKGAVWTAATLEQNFGLFESDLVREVNKFIERQCPKRMAEK